MKNLGLYIQVPFCASKCSFCNFSSQVARHSVFDAYTHALETEIAGLPGWYETASVGDGLFALPVDTVYIGGGTPSLLGPERLDRILKALQERFDLGGLTEFTLEVTPSGADEDLLKKAKALRVNRLSIGAQTFADHELRAVGRLHSADETSRLIELARSAGFDNISLDLIAGLPHQTEDSWQRSLQTTVELRPEHISVYLFEIDEKSRLGGEVLRHGARYHADAVPDDDFMAAAYETARQMLSRAGYVQYEISNFSLPGYESRHNLKYWRLEPYVGLGAGAHSFDGQCRWANDTSPELYIDRLGRGESPIAAARKLSPEEQIEEFFFLGLRQRNGVDLNLARQRWGEDRLRPWGATIAHLLHDGLLEKEGERIRLRPHAFLLSNEVFQEFLCA